jgi:LacI family transcriptional regulator
MRPQLRLATAHDGRVATFPGNRGMPTGNRVTLPSNRAAVSSRDQVAMPPGNRAAPPSANQGAPPMARRVAATTSPRAPTLASPARVVTLKDVAAQANVHPATASRALHQATRHLVRPGTARRIVRAAQSLGYVANHTAASLRTSSTRSVGVLLPDIADPMAAAFARGLEDQLTAAGYVALTGSTDCDVTRERMLLTMMRSRHVDGLILAGYPARSPLTAAASRAGLPVVIAGTVPENGTVPAVSADFSRGMRLVVDHLTELGHRAITCLTGPGETGWHRNFHAALAARGLPQPPIPVLAAKAHTVDEGRRYCRRLLAGQAPCTAIITTSDLLAAGCCQELADAGLACPEDISVTGCGDLPLAGSMTPRLTTIKLPQYHVGVQVAQLLLDRIADPGSPPVARLLPPEFIVRGSTAPARPLARSAARAVSQS